MHGTYLMEVGYKKGAGDPGARSLLEDVRHLGVKSIKSVGTAQLYRLVGNLTSPDQARIAEDLLCDPILQEYRDGARRAGEGAIVVDVWYKPGVTDVVGESVAKGIRDLGCQGISEVRTGMRYRFWGLRNREMAGKIAAALLANPLVHEHSIHAD